MVLNNYNIRKYFWNFQAFYPSPASGWQDLTLSSAPPNDCHCKTLISLYTCQQVTQIVSDIHISLCKSMRKVIIILCLIRLGLAIFLVLDFFPCISLYNLVWDITRKLWFYWWMTYLIWKDIVLPSYSSLCGLNAQWKMNILKSITDLWKSCICFTFIFWYITKILALNHLFLHRSS